MSLDVETLGNHVWTEADLDDLDEAFRYEIVDGRLLVSPRPINAHTRAVSVLFRALQAAVPAGYEVWVESLVSLPTSSRIPDLVVVRSAGIDPAAARLRPEQVALAVEVVSPSSLGDDRIRKPAEYAAAGIPDYWCVDPGQPPLITAFTLDTGVSVYRTVSGPAPTASTPYPVTLAEG